jgi:ABC-type uncharacterized transport system permease subunit
MFYEGTIIAFKRFFEYKPNFYAVVLTQIVFGIKFVFGYLVIDNFQDVIGWDFLDYSIFLYAASTTVIIMGTLYFSPKLDLMIPRGELNQYLIKPGNRFLVRYMSRITSMPIFFIMDQVLILPFILYFANYTFLSLVLFFTSLLFLGIGLLFLMLFLDSLNFYWLGVERPFSNAVNSTRNVLSVYPAKFFQGNDYKYFFMILPTFFVATLSVPLLQNNSIENLGFQLQFISIFLLIVISGTLLNWHFGLKKYEAYG